MCSFDMHTWPSSNLIHKMGFVGFTDGMKSWGCNEIAFLVALYPLHIANKLQKYTNYNSEVLKFGLTENSHSKKLRIDFVGIWIMKILEIPKVKLGFSTLVHLNLNNNKIYVLHSKCFHHLKCWRWWKCNCACNKCKQWTHHWKHLHFVGV